MIFIGLELLGLSLYVMTAFDKTDMRSAEAGLKYLLFGSTSSAFTLFGISLIYGMTGTTSLPAISQKLASAFPTSSGLLAVGIIMTLVGFAFKIAAAPFHLWAPDAYQGAPVPSAGFIASASKVASFVVLGKIVLVGFAPVRGSAAWHAMLAGWSPMLAVLAAFTVAMARARGAIDAEALSDTLMPRRGDLNATSPVFRSKNQAKRARAVREKLDADAAIAEAARAA